MQWQITLGGRMASLWASKICLLQGQNCQLLDLHKASAIPGATTAKLVFLVIPIA